MLIVIDHADATPLYRQIVRQVTARAGFLDNGFQITCCGALVDVLEGFDPYQPQ